jgi:hypothetical protein
MAARKSVNLIDFLNNNATEQERTVFTEMWSPYIRLVLGVPKASRHVRPYNVDFGLKCTLANVCRSLNELNLLNSDIMYDDFMLLLDQYSKAEKRGTADVPGYLVEMIDDQKLKDPYGFPDDSVIYREWKAISTVVGTIKQASENVETRARSVEVQNQGLVNDINNCEIVVRARAIQGQV